RSARSQPAWAERLGRQLQPEGSWSRPIGTRARPAPTRAVRRTTAREVGPPPSGSCSCRASPAPWHKVMSDLWLLHRGTAVELSLSGYARARRAGLLRSKCKLGDTRPVLAYLVLLAPAAGVG